MTSNSCLKDNLIYTHNTVTALAQYQTSSYFTYLTYRICHVWSEDGKWGSDASVKPVSKKKSLCYMIWLHWTLLENELGKFILNILWAFNLYNINHFPFTLLIFQKIKCTWSAFHQSSEMYQFGLSVMLSYLDIHRLAYIFILHEIKNINVKSK